MGPIVTVFKAEKRNSCSISCHCHCTCCCWSYLCPHTFCCQTLLSGRNWRGDCNQYEKWWQLRSISHSWWLMGTRWPESRRIQKVWRLVTAEKWLGINIDICRSSTEISKFSNACIFYILLKKLEKVVNKGIALVYEVHSTIHHNKNINLEAHKVLWRSS